MLPRESELLFLLWDFGVMVLRTGSEIGALDLAVFSGFSMFGKLTIRAVATVLEDSPNIDSNFEFGGDDDRAMPEPPTAPAVTGEGSTMSTVAAKPTREREPGFDDEPEETLRGRVASRTTVGDSPSFASIFALSFARSLAPCCDDGDATRARVECGR